MLCKLQMVDKCGKPPALPRRLPSKSLSLHMLDLNTAGECHYGRACREPAVPPLPTTRYRSASCPVKTSRPSPRSDGYHTSPSRRSRTLTKRPECVVRLVSSLESPQADSRIAAAIAPVPHASVSPSTPRS